MDEELIDGYARELYHMRSQSSLEMTDERWESIKKNFAGSVRVCRKDAVKLLKLERKN